MLDIVIDTIIDLLKIIPFLFVAFLLMEYLEHSISKKRNILKDSKLGPVIGSILGVIPQCGFSVMATNLFSAKNITMGTLIAIYLSTSDEMLPILITNKVSFKLIITILLIKVITGIIFGYLIDLIFRKKDKVKKDLPICKRDECHCEKGIFKSSIIHTLKISLYILLTTFVLNTLVYLIGEDTISKILLKNSFFGPFLASLVGLIPNCSASIILTELYLSGVITTGMLIGGLLTGAGIGILVLFKVNKDKKENLFILLSIYLIGVLIGIFLDLIKFSL